MKTDSGRRHRQFGLSLLALVSFTALPGYSQDVPPCENAKVQYSSVEDKYMEKIKVQTVTELHVPDGVEKQFSPQRTFWLYATQPNYQKDGPWATTVLIKSADGNTMRKLTLIDHGTGGVKLAWLNERLLFVQVWWGRILSTDFILDVQNREFLYQQNAYYGQLMESCK
jgi:hypothetical protein